MGRRGRKFSTKLKLTFNLSMPFKRAPCHVICNQNKTDRE